jgi:hypothetical protein
LESHYGGSKREWVLALGKYGLVYFRKFHTYQDMFAFVAGAAVKEQIWVSVVVHNQSGSGIAAFTMVRPD